MQQASRPDDENSNGELTHPVKNDVVESSVATSVESHDVRQSDSGKPLGHKQRLAAVAHGATGPRTAAGKPRSRLNSLKSGLFSNEILLKDESATQYAALLNGLWENRRPEEMLESMLVEKLATTRPLSRRRFLSAIRKREGAGRRT
jgi:hypothetical protein